jgi:hypothetical protein
MIFLDVLYIALSTIFVMVILQVVLFAGIKLMYPPPPQIIYRDVPVYQQQVQQQVQQQSPPQHQQENHVAFTEPPSEQISLPQYEPRQSATTSSRMDPELPPGLKETRPDGI